MNKKHLLTMAAAAAVLVWATPTSGITQVVLALGLHEGSMPPRACSRKTTTARAGRQA